MLRVHLVKMVCKNDITPVQKYEISCVKLNSFNKLNKKAINPKDRQNDWINCLFRILYAFYTPVFSVLHRAFFNYAHQL